MTEIAAHLAGSVYLVNVAVGNAVQDGDELVVLESMKMEIPIVAPGAGTVADVRVQPESSELVEC